MHHARTILFCALLLSFTTGAATRPTTRHEESAEIAAFWTADRIHTIHIAVSAQQWQMSEPIRGRPLERIAATAMKPPSTQPTTRIVQTTGATTQPGPYKEGQRLEPNFYGMQFAYVKSRFECDGVVLNDVGFRQRGNSSFNWAGGGPKRPFKIDFNRFVDDQRFLGLAGFYLNNNAYDPSQMRETLAYELFRNLGVKAPRTTCARVYLTIDGRLNREYLGLYTLIEEIDSAAFLKHNFGSSRGLLLKPWSIQGLPYFGEDWRAYESRYNVEGGFEPDRAQRVIDFIKLVNYADDDAFEKQIESYLDVKGFLGLLAGHVLLSNLDCFLFTGHNFYMYLNPDDNRFTLMPWDLNLAFASFDSVAPSDTLIQLSVMHPHTGQMKLIDRLLDISAYREMYRAMLEQAIAGFFSPQKMAERIDAINALLAPATTRPAGAKFQLVSAAGWQGHAAPDLKDFVTRRTASIRAQLAGQADGFTPGQRTRRRNQ